MARPGDKEYADFYHTYVTKVQAIEVTDALLEGLQILSEVISNIDEADSEYRYEAGKWSIKQIISHLIDAERIFSYRALRYARNDKTSLPGFSENYYSENTNADERTFSDLINESNRLHQSTLDLFMSFNDEMLSRSGIANKNEIRVLALGFVTAGHKIHHAKVIKDRYMVALKK